MIFDNKKFLWSLLVLGIFNFNLFASETLAFKKMQKDLDSIIVKDLSSKKLIFSKDANQVLRPASLTKIMTGMLAIESGKMNSIVTITPAMINVEPTIAGLRVGEKFYLKDLVHVAMIRSANDAANSIAIYLGNGSKEKFVAMMNAKAKKLGMKNTNFTNPCGFDIGNHKSTAKDLLALSEYAIKNPTFNSIVKLNHYAFKAINTKRQYAAYTSNKLQRNDKYVVGIKTGYTSRAGACLIARAKKGNKDILLVMLNSKNRWANAKVALEEAIKS
jgi:serine-type D-Ala-D-Ala carboxypeptidase (penicillin-binding protein 5/6)